MRGFPLLSLPFFLKKTDVTHTILLKQECLTYQPVAFEMLKWKMTSMAINIFNV